MSSLDVSIAVFAFILGSAIVGMLLRPFIPSHHLDTESKETIKTGMALVATMAALVLGLLVASAKGSFDAQSAGVTQASANIILLDRVLANYGPETNEIREVLRSVVTRVLEQTWSRGSRGPVQFGATRAPSEVLYEKILALSPENDLQRALQSQAVNLAMNLAQTRWLMFEQQTNSVSVPMLAVMVFWLAIIFISWGLFAPRNAVVVATFSVAALSVSGAIFLILEMYSPYSGLVRISSAPLRAALAHLGQ
jgi:hypothetical protein